MEDSSKEIEGAFGVLACARARVRCVTLTWFDVVVIMWFVLHVQLSAGLD